MRYFPLSIICVVLLIAGLAGCSSKPETTPEDRLQASMAELRDTLNSVVKGERLTQMLAIVDAASAELAADVARYDQLRTEQVSLYADYAASRVEFDQIAMRVHTVREQFWLRLITMRTAVAQLATDAEWEKIASRDLGIIDN